MPRVVNACSMFVNAMRAGPPRAERGTLIPSSGTRSNKAHMRAFLGRRGKESLLMAPGFVWLLFCVRHLTYLRAISDIKACATNKHEIKVATTHISNARI